QFWFWKHFPLNGCHRLGGFCHRSEPGFGRGTNGSAYGPICFAAFVYRPSQHIGSNAEPCIAITCSTRGINRGHTLARELLDKRICHTFNERHPLHASCKPKCCGTVFRDEPFGGRRNKGKPFTGLLQWPS